MKAARTRSSPTAGSRFAVSAERGNRLSLISTGSPACVAAAACLARNRFRFRKSRLIGQYASSIVARQLNKIQAPSAKNQLVCGAHLPTVLICQLLRSRAMSRQFFGWFSNPRRVRSARRSRSAWRPTAALESLESRVLLSASSLMAFSSKCDPSGKSGATVKPAETTSCCKCGCSGEKVDSNSSGECCERSCSSCDPCRDESCDNSGCKTTEGNSSNTKESSRDCGCSCECDSSCGDSCSSSDSCGNAGVVTAKA